MRKTSKEREIEKLQSDGNNSDPTGRSGRGSNGRPGGTGEVFDAYNGQVLEGASDDEELGKDWNSGKLKFRRHITDKLRKGGREGGVGGAVGGEVGGDGRRVDDYEVIDPRAGLVDDDGED